MLQELFELDVLCCIISRSTLQQLFSNHIYWHDEDCALSAYNWSRSSQSFILRCSGIHTHPLPIWHLPFNEASLEEDDASLCGTFFNCSSADYYSLMLYFPNRWAHLWKVNVDFWKLWLWSACQLSQIAMRFAAKVRIVSADAADVTTIESICFCRKTHVESEVNATAIHLIHLV